MSDLKTTLPPSVAAALDSVLEKDTSIISPVEQAAAATVTQSDGVKPVETKEEVKPVETKTETKPVETKVETKTDEEPPEQLPNTGRQDIWKTFREQYKTTKAALKEREEALKEFEGTKKERDELKTQIEELRTENQELAKIDSMSKWERHPQGGLKFQRERDAGVQSLKKLAEVADIPADELVSVLNKPIKERYTALDDLISSAPSSLKTKIINAVDAIEQIDENRQKELANTQETISKLTKDQERARQQYEEQEAKDRAATFDRVLSKLSKPLNLDDSLVKESREFFMSNGDTEKAAEVVLEAMAGKRSRDAQAKLEAELNELRAEVEQYRSGSPSIRSGGATESHQDKDLDFVSAILKGAREVKVI